MLVAFTLFVPENSGLQRFNYLALQYLPRAKVQLARGEKIPELVDQYGGYGWTGNDLYQDYVASGKGKAIQQLQFLPWPEEPKPKLCLLGPGEFSLSWFETTLYSALGNIRIAIADKYEYLAWDYIDVQGWSPSVISLPGQVDRQIRREGADLAIDIVYTKKTIQEEQLSVYDTIFNQAGFVLITKDI